MLLYCDSQGKEASSPVTPCCLASCQGPGGSGSSSSHSTTQPPLWEVGKGLRKVCFYVPVDAAAWEPVWVLMGQGSPTKDPVSPGACLCVCVWGGHFSPMKDLSPVASFCP